MVVDEYPIERRVEYMIRQLELVAFELHARKIFMILNCKLAALLHVINQTINRMISNRNE